MEKYTYKNEKKTLFKKVTITLIILFIDIYLSMTLLELNSNEYINTYALVVSEVVASSVILPSQRG